MNSPKVWLIILDGRGIAQDPTRSAIAQAHTPNFDHLWDTYPHTTLITYGEQVGLPEGQMGNSEVWHMNIGAWRVVYQDLVKIGKSMREWDFANNETLIAAINQAKSASSPIHLIWLVSDGGVHSHIDHLEYMIDICHNAGVQTVVHAITDGRDVGPQTGIGFITRLHEFCQTRNSHIQSIIGRYYAMDRDNRWERVAKAYDLMVKGQGQSFNNPVEALQASYDTGIYDEFVEPITISRWKDTTEDTKDTLWSSSNHLISTGSIVIVTNFRTDRGREIVNALSQQDHLEYHMKKLDLTMITMTNYDDSFQWVHVLSPRQNLTMTLWEVLSLAGKTQLRIAETEKYPHVTFFFSGGQEVEFEGEHRIVIPSPKVATYDLQPEMSAPVVTQSAIQFIQDSQPDFVVLNYANTDMVWHTWMMNAAVKAAEAVDAGLGQLIDSTLPLGYTWIVIADHGNADIITNKDGSPHTAHTLNPVPCIIVSQEPVNVTLSEGKLADVAPTILKLMWISQPPHMDGISLI